MGGEVLLPNDFVEVIEKGCGNSYKNDKLWKERAKENEFHNAMKDMNALEIKKQTLDFIVSFIDNCNLKELLYLEEKIGYNGKFEFKVNKDSLQFMQNNKYSDDIIYSNFYKAIRNIIKKNSKIKKPAFKFAYPHLFTDEFYTNKNLRKQGLLGQLHRIIGILSNICEIVGFKINEAGNTEAFEKILYDFFTNLEKSKTIFAIDINSEVDSILKVESLIYAEYSYFKIFLPYNKHLYKNSKGLLYFCDFEMNATEKEETKDIKPVSCKIIDISDDIKTIQTYIKDNRNRQALKRYFKMIDNINIKAFEMGLLNNWDYGENLPLKNCKFCRKKIRIANLCEECKEHIRAFCEKEIIPIKYSSITHRLKEIENNNIRGNEYQLGILKNLLINDTKLSTQQEKWARDCIEKLLEENKVLEHMSVYLK